MGIHDTRSLKKRMHNPSLTYEINRLGQKLNNKVFETDKPKPVKAVKNTKGSTDGQ